MTAVSYVALALAVVAVALLVARQRSLRTELETTRRGAAEAATKAEEAERAHRQRESSTQEQLAASTARAAEAEEALSRQATAAEARVAELEASSGHRIGELERSLHQAKAELREMAKAAATRAAEAEAAQTRTAEVESAATAAREELEATGRRIAALEAELAARRSAGSAPASAAAGGEAGWHLLLARVERQWADLVNAGAEERGVADGSRAEQLTQAAGRELERLREEVGVETAMTVTGPVDAEHALTTLLVVGEAAAQLAARSEHVSVELGEQAVVTGQDWTGDEDARRRLDELAATATAAGRPAVVVEPGDGAVRVIFG